MKILITGGYGFIGSHVADRFYKEGHEIFIIDNLSTGKSDNVKIKHHFYRLSIQDKQCEEVFKSIGFDIVIHMAAQNDVHASFNESNIGTEVNLLGLTNMLYLSSQYGVKKFIFPSSALVYGDQESLPVNEQTDMDPMCLYSLNKSVSEFYCMKWKDIYALDTICFRFSNVYGPRQLIYEEAGVISKFINKIIQQEPLTVYGDGEQSRDFIYVQDLVDAIYKGAQTKKCSGIYNLSTNKEKSLNELLRILEKIRVPKAVFYTKQRENDILASRLDNTKVKNVLNWEPIVSFEEGLQRTYNWYQANNQKESKQEKKKNKKDKKDKKETSRWSTHLLPLVENILIFIVITVLTLKGVGAIHLDTDLYIYFCIVYIGLMGILYGQRQSIIAIILSIILYLLNFNRFGGDMIIFIYDPTHFMILFLYILVGIITGYSVDRKNRMLYTMALEMESKKDKYDFLLQLHNETSYIKDELQKQIINSKDSFGKIYSIVEKLKHLEIEKIFNGTIDVIEEVMKTKKAAVYTKSSKADFLRLKAKSGTTGFYLRNSIDLREDIGYGEIVKGEKIFINKDLNPKLPILAAPIIDHNKVVALVAVYEVEFENLTLYYQNLFKVLVNLIADSLSRAYRFEESSISGKYIDDTTILNSQAFKDKLHLMKEKYKKFNMNYLLFRINNKASYKEINNRLGSIIRMDDFIGLGEDDNIYLLLSNADIEHIEGIFNRFNKKGIKATLIEGDSYD